MKHNRRILHLFAFCLACCAFLLQFSAQAAPAYPRPIRVTQPDGTVLTVQLHGDEFLHWTTCNNRLVTRASDGFYYYANFNADGTIQRTSTRATQQDVSLQSFGSEAVVPPVEAQLRAAQLRSERASEAMATQMGAEQMNFFTHGSFPFLAILVNFKDVKFVSETANADFFNLLNEDGYSANGGTGSCRDYYYDNSNGVFSPTYEVYGPVELPNKMAYYGENDSYGSDMNPRAMVYDAVKEAIDNHGLDITRFDCNDDGVLDNVFIFYAGYGESQGGPADSIWPHKWVGYGTFQGVSIETYACGSELRGADGTLMDGIGTFTHEFGHVLGLPDFYDVDYDTNGYARALGYYSLMDSGCYNNDSSTPPYLTSMERHLLNWSEGPVELTQSGDYALDPVQENSSFWTPTDNPGEYFMYEYRDKTGWDAYIPEKGLLIYHVDQSQNNIGGWLTAAALWSYGNINSYASHQCFNLIEAVGEENVQDERQVPFPGLSNNTTFDADSYPPAWDWAGNPTNYNLTNITENGTFHLTVSQGMRVSGRVRNQSNEGLADATVELLDEVLKETYATTTDEEGEYLFNVPRNPAFVQATARGYLRYVRRLEGTRSNYAKTDFLMNEILEEPSLRIEKFEGLPAATVKADANAYVGVGISAEELTVYEGYTISGVEFSMNPSMSRPSKMGVFVYDRTASSMLVEREITVPMSFESAVWVDLSDVRLRLDASHSYVFGYFYEGSQTEDPVLVDKRASASEGALVSEDGRVWKTLSGGDVLVSLGVNKPEAPSVFPMIYVDRTTYQTGDRLRLRLRDCPIEPQEILWMVNGRVCQTNDRVVLESGTVQIRAILTFSDGSRQTLVQEIEVI